MVRASVELRALVDATFSLTRMTETFRINGFCSGIRIGLVLLLWPGVGLLLFVLRWLLRRCGNGNRTMVTGRKCGGNRLDEGGGGQDTSRQHGKLDRENGIREELSHQSSAMEGYWEI